MREWQPTQCDALEALREIETYLESPATDGGWLNDRCAVVRAYVHNKCMHIHVNNPDSDGDDCAKCGLDLRNPIHLGE